MNLIVTFLLLTISWIALSGFFNLFFATLGAVSIATSLYFYLKTRNSPKNFNSLSFIFKLIPYSLWLIKEIILSSISVALKVWQLDIDVSPKTGWVKADQTNDIGITIFANSITLTPGTVSIIAEKNKIFVHALSNDTLESLEEGTMNKKTTKLTS